MEDEEPAEDPLTQECANQSAPVVVHPYAIEEPEDDSPTVSPTPATTCTPEYHSENWQTELVDSLDLLHCDSDHNMTSPIPKEHPGKKRKPSSSIIGNSGFFQEQGSRRPCDNQYYEGPRFKIRRLRRRNQRSTEALGSTRTAGLSDVGLSDLESSESFCTWSSSSEENGTDSNPETNVSEHMDLDS
ncbi:hypothetical protein BDV28DRAFT_150662 [Aspergillus coremiiformis]|uniref:Uncharacterized protein n=1 Tax=Aspergillus coremiiformis TaxID=138285 RepID=A0A5N6YZ72_9EURO|nr:hypothetical protein BDV28DRAFT_150662 [Aspergillus coremiiformis]